MQTIAIGRLLPGALFVFVEDELGTIARVLAQTSDTHNGEIVSVTVYENEFGTPGRISPRFTVYID